MDRTVGWKWMLLAGLGLAGCKTAPSPEPAVPASKDESPQAKRPKDVIYRVELEHVLRKGPGWFLGQVPIEESMEAGKFVGWRVVELPFEWRDIEIEPGDVVTSVNAMPLETPADFWSAWTTLSVASEIKVAFLRDGEPREISYRVDGTPDPSLAKELKDTPKKTAPSQRRGPQKKTVVIEGDDKPVNETMVDWSQ